MVWNATQLGYVGFVGRVRFPSALLRILSWSSRNSLFCLSIICGLEPLFILPRNMHIGKMSDRVDSIFGAFSTGGWTAVC